MAPDILSDLVDDEDTLLPECIINVGYWCGENVDTAVSWCVDVCSRAFMIAQEKFLKYEREIIIIIKCISILMYILDLGTDIFTSIKYFSYHKSLAGSVTTIFAILPMLFLSFKLIFYTSLGSQSSINVNFLPILSAVVCSPILPLGWLVLDLVASISVNESNSNSDNNIAIGEATRLTAAKAAKLVKLFVAVVESFPQATIQLFIVFSSLAMGENIELWQWGSIAASLTSLSLSVSTGYLNSTAASSSKVIYFLFGLLAVSARQVVCCIYSIHHPFLWLLPFCAQLVASTIIWSISSMCQGQWTSLLIFVLTEAYNCFTLSGLLTSSLYFGFALGAFFFIEVKSEAHNVITKLLILAVELTTISLVFNFLFTVIPQCNGIRMDWMKKSNIETTQLNAEGTSNIIMESQSDPDGGLSNVTKTQPGVVEVSIYAPETEFVAQSDLTYIQETESITSGESSYATENQTNVKGDFIYAFQTHANADGALTSVEESPPTVVDLTFAGETQRHREEVSTYATETQPGYENTIFNTDKTKSDARKSLIDVKIVLHDMGDSLKNIKGSQIHNKKTLSDTDKTHLDTKKTRADSKENNSDIEETWF